MAQYSEVQMKSSNPVHKIPLKTLFFHQSDQEFPTDYGKCQNFP